jgi:hypothetical protein
LEVSPNRVVNASISFPADDAFPRAAVERLVVTGIGGFGCSGVLFFLRGGGSVSEFLAGSWSRSLALHSM